MNEALVFLNDDGFPCVVTLLQSDLTVAQHAARAVPMGVPFLVVDKETIPFTDEEKLVWKESLDWTEAKSWGLI